MSIICGALGLPDTVAKIVNIIAYLWVLVCGACFAISAFTSKDRYKPILLGFLAICCIPSLTSLYTWAFMIIPITLICTKRTPSRADTVRMVIASLPFAFIPFRISYHVTPSMVLVYLATVARSVYEVSSTLGGVAEILKNKKIKA